MLIAIIFFKNKHNIFLLVQNTLSFVQVLIILSQSDDECFKHSKYITDRTLVKFLTSGNLFSSSYLLDRVVTASMLHQDCFKITSRLLQDFFKSTSLRNYLLVIIFTREVLHILAVTDLISPNHKVRIMWLSLQLKRFKSSIKSSWRLSEDYF